MYVLADLEWITDRDGNRYPTQLAAAHVDHDWNTLDTFSVLFCPKAPSLQQWDHMAYAGHSPEEFRSGGGLEQNLYAFEQWLRPDDVVCWWHRDLGRVFHLFCKMSISHDPLPQSLTLRSYVFDHLYGENGSPAPAAVRNTSPPLKHAIRAP